MLSIQTILHPTDFSERSTAALPVACSLARSCHAKLLVLHVAKPPVEDYGGGIVSPETERGWEEMRKSLECVRCAGCAVQVDYLLLEGEPAAQIVQAAKETKCDLIVMGTHGRTGLKRLLTGSVAEHVLRNAPCAVLTVKAAPGDEHQYLADEVNLCRTQGVP
jgi:nucleotide-binding universal stress UspA family protein